MYACHFSGLKAKAYSSAPPWGPSSSDDGKWARAALLSGPPGIGKTSTAILVCKELGYTYCEFNASDCRSKRCLSEEIGQSLGLRNLSHMAFGQGMCMMIFSYFIYQHLAVIVYKNLSIPKCLCIQCSHSKS